MNIHRRQIRELNGDENLHLIDRLRYLFNNFCRNLFASRSNLYATLYTPDHIENYLLSASPLRAYAETFMVKELPFLLPPGTIHVLDIGCGSGRSSELLAFAGYTGEYVGIDIGAQKPHQFSSTHAFRCTYQNIDAHRFTSDNFFDLIISMSALEHIDRDECLIPHLEKLLSNRGAQSHVVPSAWSLALYLWHGYRQYGLSSLESRFGADGIRIYALGGGASFLLHILFITLGETLLRVPMRRWFRRFYHCLHHLCHRIDRYVPFAPSGYVVFRPSLQSRSKKIYRDAVSEGYKT